MRKMNSTALLSKTASHRKAMFGNMAASLIMNERIVTTKQKAKVLRVFTERMVTRAKRNLILGETDSAKKVHNKRIILKDMKDRDALAKLFNDIALRNKDRNGGYTRIVLLGRRPGDAAEQAIIEFVEKKTKAKKSVKAADQTDKGKEKKDNKEKKEKKASKEKKEKK
jgi:large subunit ribosomal protein L17